MTDYVPPPEWRFGATIEGPDGYRVEVSISVPEGVATADVREQAEIASMAANNAFVINASSAAQSARRFADEEKEKIA